MGTAAAATTTNTIVKAWCGRNLASPTTKASHTTQPTASFSRVEVLAIAKRSEGYNSVISFSVSHQRQSRTISRNGTPSLTHCSMKPGIDSDNTTSKNPEIKLDPNSPVHQPAASAPERALSSMNCKGLVLDLGPEYSWDGGEVGSPVVKRYIGDDEERWYMWYHGRLRGEDGGQLIGLAVSSNGICWGRGAGPVRSSRDVGTVMSCSSNWWAFDTSGIRPSEVLIMSSSMYTSVYWLYYTGCTDEEVELPEFPSGNSESSISDAKRLGQHRIGKIYKSLPGLACSQDGRQWARIEGDLHSGALLDVGAAAEWDSLFIGAPQVVMHCGADLRMYYHSYDIKRRRFAIGMARSRDGIRWVKLGKVMECGGDGSFDELGVMNAHVTKRKDGTYLMAYEGVSADGTRSIGLAISQDGLKKWTRIKDVPVLEPSGEDGWDNGGVGSPCLVHMEGSTDEWRLYYQGTGQEGRTGIGMAVSNGSDIGKFNRWEGFHL